MSPFRYGSDYDTDVVAQQLLSASVWLLMALVGIFLAVHLLRRSFGHPISSDPVEKLPSNLRLLKYEAGARLYHWGNTIVVLGLTLSGVALFAPGSFDAGPWLLIHEVAAVAFVALLGLHVVVAPRRGDARSMWFERRDVRDLRIIAANFLGRSHSYPAFGKYDPLQKVYHALLTLLATGVIVSGAYLLVSAETWATFSHGWMRAMRVTHDVTAFPFLGIVVGHVYFGVIRVNWPLLVSMCTGRLRGSSFNLYHDARRWRPPGETRQEVGRVLSDPADERQ
jgi:Ni/Fe-hydrogenase 1 B-type cytochrome subunit